jgi:hypothetical protein
MRQDLILSFVAIINSTCTCTGRVVCNVGNDSIFSVVNLEIVHSCSAPAES